MNRLIVLLGGLVFLSGCSVLGHFGSEEKPFRYKPPAAVSDVDRKDCESEAKSAASKAGSDVITGKGMDTAALLLGPLFVFGAGAHAFEAEEQGYEEKFKACLKGKGYSLE